MFKKALRIFKEDDPNKQLTDWIPLSLPALPAIFLQVVVFTFNFPSLFTLNSIIWVKSTHFFNYLNLAIIFQMLQ